MKLYRFFLQWERPITWAIRGKRNQEVLVLSATQAITVIIAVFGTSILSGIFGMAGGLVLMGVLAAILPVPLAMTAHGFAQLIANGTRCLSLLKHVHWHGLKFYLIGLAAAAGIFWFVLFTPSRAVLFLTLGIIPIAALLPRTPKLDFQKPSNAILCGFLNTAAHLTAGVSGPVLDLFFVHSKMNRFEIIATKAFTQTIGHALKIGYFASASLALAELPVEVPVAVAASAVAGTHVGGWCLRRMSEASFRIYLRRIFLLVGCVYLLQGARELM